MNIVFDIDDTLIFDNGRSAPNMQIVEFLKDMKSQGHKIHLITARAKSVEKMTKQELSRSGIPWDTLDLAFEKDRVSLAATSAFKSRARAQYAPVAVTIGDQWGDMTILNDDSDIDAWDAKTCAEGVPNVLNGTCSIERPTPWVLVTPNDNNSFLGLKLMANRR